MNIWQIIQHKVTATQNMPSFTRPPSLVEKDTGVMSAALSPEKSAPPQTTQERIQAIVSQKGDNMHTGTIRELVSMIDRLSLADKEKAIDLLKMLSNRIGITDIPEKLQMLLSSLSDKETTLQTLVKVEKSLQNIILPTPAQQKLMEVIQQMQQPLTIHSKTAALQFIRHAFTLLGLDFEKGLSDMMKQGQPFSEGKVEQIKPLLMNYLQQVETPEEKTAITQLLSRLTSFQLLSREEGNLQHIFLPLPMKMHDDAKEWYIHLSSKKKNGMLDPDFCRVVLLLDMPVFSSVLVDVYVQQKVVSISLQHSYQGMEELVERSSSLLRKSLAVKGFTLSAIKPEWKEQEKSPGIPVEFLKAILNPIEKGLDIRI